VEAEVELVVQVNGRTRAKVSVPRGADQEAAVARALGDETVLRFVGEQQVRKTIHVPDRLLNLVVG